MSSINYDREVYRSTISMLNANEDMAYYLRSLINLELRKRKEMGMKYYIEGFSIKDIGSIPSYIIPVMANIYGILKKVKNNPPSYIFVDINASAKALTDFLGGTEYINTEPATDIPDDLFDDIIGYDHYKKIIIKALRSPRPVHILLEGSPGTAKSLFLLDIARLPGSRYTIGSRVSKSGIAEYLYEYRPKFIIIDEIDKMSRKDQAVLLSFMETGIVSIMLHKNIISFRVDTRVIAACNNKNMLLKELRDRFLILPFKEYSSEEFLKMVPRTLIIREGVDPELAEYIAKKLVNYTRSVRDAIKVARMARSKEDVDMIVDVVFKKKTGVFEYSKT